MALKDSGVLPQAPSKYLSNMFKEKGFISPTEMTGIIVDVPFEHLRCGDTKWLETWDAFLEEHGKNSIYIWVSEQVEMQMSIKELFSKLQRGFERLEKLKPEMYKEIVTSEFWHILLYYLSKRSFLQLLPDVEEKIIHFIRGKFDKKPTTEDLWNALKALQDMDKERDGLEGINVYYPFYGQMEGIMHFMTLWKECFQQNIEVDLADKFQAEVVFQYCLYADSFDDSNIEKLFSLVSYFRNGKDDFRMRELADSLILKAADKEICYKSLETNLINNRTAAYAATKLFKEAKNYDLLPMLIMKIHGEW